MSCLKFEKRVSLISFRMIKSVSERVVLKGLGQGVKSVTGHEKT